MENWQIHHSTCGFCSLPKNMDNSAWNFNAIWYEFWVRSTIILKTVKKSKKNLFLIFIWHSLESVPRKIIDFEEGHDISKSESKLYTYIYIKSSSSVMRIEEEEREKRDRFHKENCCFKYLKKIFYFVGRIVIRIGHRLWMVHQASSECYFSHLIYPLHMRRKILLGGKNSIIFWSLEFSLTSQMISFDKIHLMSITKWIFQIFSLFLYHHTTLNLQLLCCFLSSTFFFLLVSLLLNFIKSFFYESQESHMRFHAVMGGMRSWFDF